MERAALLAGAREERMFPYRRILLLALAVLLRRARPERYAGLRTLARDE